MERSYSESGGSDSSYFGDYGSSYGNVPLPVPVKTEPMPTLMGPGSGRNGGVIKYCGVCGDVAKSFHFGGLSCDSCKAFFRRSVQNDNYLQFQCAQIGECVISLANRKSCQFCRMKSCFAIGMEKSWVMTEEERKALMKARAEKKLRNQMQAAKAASGGSPETSPTKTNVKGSPTSSSCSSGDENVREYVPEIGRMRDFMQPLEVKEIESIVTKYLHSYRHVPYRTELRYQDHHRPGYEIMEVCVGL